MNVLHLTWVPWSFAWLIPAVLRAMTRDLRTWLRVRADCRRMTRDAARARDQEIPGKRRSLFLPGELPPVPDLQPCNETAR